MKILIMQWWLVDSKSVNVTNMFMSKRLMMVISFYVFMFMSCSLLTVMLKWSIVSKICWIQYVHYAIKINDYSIVKTPLDTGKHLLKNKRKSISHLKYFRIIGSLMYLISCTRPNITYTVSKLTRYMSDPRVNHRKAIIKILMYLLCIQSYGLHYTRYPVVV